MFLIGFTNKTSKKLKLILEPKPEVVPMEIACWHANHFIWNRKCCLVVMNDRSRYSVLLYGVKVSDMKRFDELFKEQLKTNLINDGVSNEIIDRYIESIDEIVMTKTSSRSILGSLNDLFFCIEGVIREIDLERYTDLDALNQEVNDMVMLPLDKVGLTPFPNRAMKEELNRIFMGNKI